MKLVTACSAGLVAGLWTAVVVGTGACMTNPTPHPERDATSNTGFADTAAPSADGPDEDQDGVPDCVELSGTWDGQSCLTANTDVDGATAGDTTPDDDGTTSEDGYDGTPIEGDAASDSASAPGD